MLIIVCDTNACVRALINTNSAWGRLLFIHRDQYQLVLCREIVEELIGVLNRPALTRKIGRTTDSQFIRMLDIIASAHIVNLVAIPAISRDPNDDMFLEAARVANADYLVSGDNDLLSLGTHDRTRIVTAVELVRLFEEDPGDVHA